MRLFLVWAVAVLLTFYSVVSFATSAIAEVVWVEYSDELHHIYFSRYDGETWTDSGKPIYSSDRALTGPALGTDSSGKKVLFWSEQRKLKTVLMSMTSVANSNDNIARLDWADPMLFSDSGLENLGSTIVFDNNDDGWLFWSANKLGDVSNIFLSKYNGLIWSDPQKVNSTNKVPNFSPIASVNLSGDVSIKWNTYDPKLVTYAIDSKVYIIENSVEIDISRERSIDDILLPTFLPNNQRLFIHFPGNKMEQSTPLN